MAALLKNRTLIFILIIAILSFSNFITFKLYSECKERVKIIENMYEKELDKLNAKLEECKIMYKQTVSNYKKELKKKDKICKEYLEQMNKLEEKINEILNL